MLDNMLTIEQIFQNIDCGIIVTDEKDNILIFNSFAEKLIKKKANEVIGKNILDVIPNGRLSIVNKTGKPELMYKQVLGENVVVINRTPVIIEGKPKGAIAIFNDISNLEKVKEELIQVKELENRLQLILQSVQDGICVLDGCGIITYVNAAYVNILNIKKEDILGKNINEVSPNGARSKVLASGKSIVHEIIKKDNGVTIVSNVNPIMVDGKISGVISVVKKLKEVQILTDKLNEMSAKADYLEEELIRTRKPEQVFSKFIGKSGKIVDALAVAIKAACSNATILIRGESGTGKELIAEGIHYASANCNGPFIRVNCAAIPENLLESELFGYEKGAFTGAIKRKLGKFELAHTGTIFLDEIGEMEKNMQSKILRVLQEKELQRVGGEETIKIDVRIIAATNRDLEEMVQTGDFREDLYYRLNVIPVFLPPLRERRQDIGLLVEYFMNKFQSITDKKIQCISNDAMEALLMYTWPGNIRELENTFERIYALVDGNVITLNDLPPYIRFGNVDKKTNTENEIDYNSIAREIEFSKNLLTMEEYEKIIIEKALKMYGSYNSAGKALGLTHKTVAAKARKFGIDKVTTWEKVSR